jgi:pilus assembly protein Flp/PilA
LQWFGARRSLLGGIAEHFSIPLQPIFKPGTHGAPRGTWSRLRKIINLEVNLKKVFSKFLSDESGATAIEYGLIAAGIALAIIAAVNGVGVNLNDKFTSINSSLK